MSFLSVLQLAERAIQYVVWIKIFPYNVPVTNFSQHLFSGQHVKWKIFLSRWRKDFGATGCLSSRKKSLWPTAHFNLPFLPYWTTTKEEKNPVSLSQICCLDIKLLQRLSNFLWDSFSILCTVGVL